jgi:hypothetical protein
MTKSKKATLDDYGAIEFEAWQHEEGEWVPPSNEKWAQLANPHLVTACIAWLTMFRTKNELMEMLDGLDDEAGRELMERFTDTVNFFKGFTALLEGAEARILCAGSALIKQDEETKA